MSFFIQWFISPKSYKFEVVKRITFLPANIFDPGNLGMMAALAVAYLLGLAHGITPDEHTWPITFSYAVGSYSTKGGIKAGLIFSGGFTLQRSLMSELAYFALIGIFMTSVSFGIIYVLVGVAMAAAGLYIKRYGVYLHWHALERLFGRITGVHRHGSHDQNRELKHTKNPLSTSDAVPTLRAVPGRLALVHGLIAGFGFGAFALVLFTVITPSMPNAYVAWLPGFFFGLGTMTMQMAFGAVFGTALSKIKHLGKKGIAFVARNMSSDVLLYGGIAFIFGGVIILLFPEILGLYITTPLNIPNLNHLDIGFFMVVLVVVAIGIVSYFISIRKAARLFGLRTHRTVGASRAR